MKKLIWLLLFLTWTASVFAQQQQSDTVAVQRMLAILQNQRNQVMDVAASHEARATALADELAKAQARIKELEARPAEPKN
jgi:TolA-binding protein